MNINNYYLGYVFRSKSLRLGIYATTMSLLAVQLGAATEDSYLYIDCNNTGATMVRSDGSSFPYTGEFPKEFDFKIDVQQSRASYADDDRFEFVASVSSSTVEISYDNQNLVFHVNRLSGAGLMTGKFSNGSVLMVGLNCSQGRPRRVQRKF